MECSGLKENMDLEEAFEIIITTHYLWKCVLTASGRKKEELWKEKLVIKANDSILDLRQTVESKTIKRNFFMRLEESRVICLELFTLVEKKENRYNNANWMRNLDEMETVERKIRMTIEVFEIVKQETDSTKSPVIEHVFNCLKIFKKAYEQYLEGNISIGEATTLVRSDDIFHEIWEVSFEVKEVINSKVFWNIFSKTELSQDDRSINADESELDDSMESLHNGRNFLMHLSSRVKKEYKKFWCPLMSGEDVCMSVLQTNINNADIMQELKTAETIFNCTANAKSLNAVKMYNKFEEHREKVDLMKNVLKAFNVDIDRDKTFQRALSEYEQLLEGNIKELTLFDIGSSLEIVDNVVNIVDNQMLAILAELQKASHLIGFLNTVVDEDIRNLIDAVEEHSEQYVRESTVSDLIEIKRFLQPLLKQKHDDDVQLFFAAMNESKQTSGIKRVEEKVHECSSNLHSLKALYNHVANRGEHTKEIIKNIVTKGEFRFYLKEKECDVFVDYTQEGKKQVYSNSYLNDLRSRALLILNTQEKQPDQNKKEHLSPFIEMVDTALEIGHMLVLLKEAGHFQYVEFEQISDMNSLHDLLKHLKSKYDDWRKVLCECRKRFYLMNYIHSDQLQLLYNFTKYGTSKDSVIAMLSYINPSISDLEGILNVLKQEHEDNYPEKSLEALGHTLESMEDNLVATAETMFDRTPTSKLYDIVHAGRLYVTALELDSNLVVRTILALHWHTTQNIPFAHNILLCNKNTSQDEITLLLNRCLECKNKQLFTIANIEMLLFETQTYLLESLKRVQDNSFCHLALLFRGENNLFHEKFADFLMPPKPITENELRELFASRYTNVLTVTSEVPGLGKSEEIQKLALQSNKGKITLHISGIFDRENIIEELIKLKIKPYHVLHIDVGPVNEPFELDFFLFELIVLKHVYARKFSYHLQTDYICIEIANSINQELSNSLPTVTCFKRKNLIWNNYNDMLVSQEVNSPVQVVCHYLDLQDAGLLDQSDIYLTGNEKVSPLSQSVCKDLLQKHFSTSGDMSYTILNTFLGVLADQLKKLSSSVFFRTANIQHELLKSELVNALKNMSTEFSSRSINACRSAQIASMGFSKLSKENVSLTCAEILAKRTESMIRWEDSNHLMVLFHYDLHTVSALYRDRHKVPQQILNLFESQLKEKLQNFEKKSQEELRIILLKLVQYPPKMDSVVLDKMSKQYVLTPDNLLKMVLIVLRIQGNQPIIIMGETGCGKTSLIRYLSVICQIEFQILSIHAGVTEETIMKRIMECDCKAKANFKQSVWLFLDEINTCDHLGLICDIICHHHCKGKRLAPNLKILGACNPYRLRSDKSILTSGLQGKIKTDHLSKLVYRVKPLPETMIDYVWDYGTLQKNDEESYIKRMVQGLFPNEKFVELFVILLQMSQQFVRDEEESDCCVSLRDFERCKRLALWFVNILKLKDDHILNQLLEPKAMILALSICYHSRFSDNNVRKRYRQKIATCFDVVAELQFDREEAIKKVIVGQQDDILNRMELPLGTAKNTALRENVFVILVCILNRIPVFVVGKPGCSKSLSMQLIRSNLRGRDSGDSFFRSLPQLYCVSFQGSESSTSDGIIKVFEKANNYQMHNQSEAVLSVVILDEIGLAEISRFNPLKVLHSLLEPENQINPDVSVVGISNWALDSAKMNRAIHLSRPEMSENELFETALSITESLMGDFSTMPDKFAEMFAKIKSLAGTYWRYNGNQKYKNFHGLRDFYSLIKYIGNGILLDKQNDEEIDNVIVRGLLRNFGGLSKELSISMLSDFETCLTTNCNRDFDVISLIKDNLNDTQSRHLMLITNGDAVLSVLEDAVNEIKRHHIVIFGSQFEEDLTDEYNYRVLSRIILCMEQGFILILKDLENIYGSLYDMLNQNYISVGSKKNCRIALGPYSNPMCHVHEDFKCIVLVEESKLDFSDPPFLNRFEKQQFRFEDMMDKKTIQIRDDLLKFMTDFCKTNGHEYKPGNVFALSGEDVISSLVLKLQKEDSDKQAIVQKGQRQLLWITAPEAMIRIRDTILWETKPNSVKKLEKEYYGLPIHMGLLKLLKYIHSKNCHEIKDPGELRSDSLLVVVFTHDHELEFLYKQSTNFKIEWLRNFKSEKQLNKKIHQFFDSDSNHFFLICSGKEDFGHIRLAKSILEMCKRNEKQYLQQKTICFICHLHRERDESMDQINFLSDWKLVMLDRLCESLTPLPDMIGLNLEEVLESRRPLTETVRNHIFWAFTTIQYIGIANTTEKMMQTVSTLKEADNCLSVIENLVFANIYKSSDTQFDNWQRTVAYNEGALVKASCFMNALEQYMLDQIKNPLSKIIFKLEEANAFDCVFLKDDCREKRILLWNKMMMKESYIDVSDMKDPCGPEFYTCSSERLSLKFPFSYIVIHKVEQLRDDFLKVLRQLRKANDFSDGDELETSVLIKFVEQYNNDVKEHLVEYIEEDYPRKFSEYQHDFYLMMSLHEIEVLNEEEKVQIMKTAQTLFDTGEYFHDFALQVTNLHVLQWVYSSVFYSFTKVMSVVKENTNISVVSFLTEETENPVSLDEVEDIKSKRQILVDKLSRIFLPTTNFMIQFTSVKNWQYLVSTVLPLLAEISLDSPSIHVLRFCNDVAQALHSLEQNAALSVLSTFGDSLLHCTSLESSEMFQFVMTQVNILRRQKNVDIENIQRFLCQYMLRSFSINDEGNATLKSVLVTITQKPMLDINLQFFGPILEFVLEIENHETDLIGIISMNLEQLEEDGYLYHINRCICECPDSFLPSLVVTTLQRIYQEKITPDRIESIVGSSDEICELAIKANAVLRKHEKCSLNLVASIAFLQALINAFVALLVKNDMSAVTFPIITKLINALMEKNADKTDVEEQRTCCLIVYFLKCISLFKEGFELRKTILNLENCLPVLPTLITNEEFMTRSVTYDPMFMYRTIDDQYFEKALLSMEKQDEKKLGEIVDHASTNSETMFSLVGFIASIFYLKSQQKEMNDTKRAISECIGKIMHTKLSNNMIKSRVVKMLLKITDFAHPMLDINSETRSPDIQIVSVLIHLLCIIIFKGEAGNCWFNILTDLKNIESVYLPGNVCNQIKETFIDHSNFYDHCNLRFVSTQSKCPKCHKECELNELCQRKEEIRRKGYQKPSDGVLTTSKILQPFACHLLQFLIHGCVLLSYAIRVVDIDQLKSLLCIEEKPDDFLFDVLQKKWKNLKYHSQMNNEDLCVFINAVIHDIESAFTLQNTPYHCRTVEDCEQVERYFQFSLQSSILRKYKCIQNARRLLYERKGMDQHALEWQIQEVYMSEDASKLELQLPNMFRMTSPESKDGFVAQVFQGNNQMKFPLLSLILKHEDILTLPKYIYAIMQWHRSTVSIGSYKIKKVDCKNETINKLLNLGNDDKEKKIFASQFQEFLTKWNDLLMSPTAVFEPLLREQNFISKQDKIINCIIIDDNSIIYKVLIKLVEIHNYFIESCLQFSSTSPVQSLYFMKTSEKLSQVKSTSLWEMTSKDVLQFNSLDENILHYSQCKLSFGEGRDRFYNLQKIENELAHDLILGKPFIFVPPTFPKISFLDELFQNTLQLLNIIRKSIPQKELPQYVVEGILKKKDENSHQIVDLMTVLGMSLSLLNKRKGEPNMPFTDYLENWKDIAVFPKGFKHLLPEPEKEIKLCHVVNLYIKLEELNGDSVIDSMEKKYRVNLPLEGEEKLKKTGKTCLGHLEVLLEALKIFIHRCLAVQNNQVSLNQELVDYLQDEQFWPQGNLKDGAVCVKGRRKNLKEIIGCSVCVQHIYKTINFIRDFIKVRYAD